MKNTKATNNTKLYAIMIILALIIALLCISFSGIIKAQAEVTAYPIGYEQKIYSTVDLDDDFDDSCVIVVMDKYSSKFNKSHSKLFSKLPFKKVIKDMTTITENLIDKLLYLNKESFRQILKIELEEPSKQNVLSAINEIQKLNGVLCVGVNRYYYPTVSDETPIAMSGTRYQQQWALNGDYGINADDAWNYSTGSKKVKVGIIDSGIADHEDLRDNVIDGWNFADDSNDTSDQYGHGTNAAGIIGATGATENGVIGINWNVEMVPLKVISTDYEYEDDKLPSYDGSAIIKAINWSINNNVDILNMSFGNLDDKGEYDHPYRFAMNNYEGLMVCGAGNNGTDNDTTGFYPANYSQGEEFSDRVISVGAINSNGNLATFTSTSSTNYGATTVSLFAPGLNLLTTCVPNVKSYLNDPSGYKEAAGTSNAAPQVAGVAALLFTRYYRYIDKLNGGHIAAHIKATLLDNVTLIGSCYKMCVSNGILNAANALKNCSHIPSIMSGVGYNDGWYYWEGRVDLEGEKPNSITYNDDGELIIKKSTDLNFTMTTTSAFNAVSEINIDMSFVLKNSSGEVVNIGLEESYNHTVTVGLVSNSKFGICDFTVYESQLVDKEKYTLTWTCKSTRKNKSYTYTRSFSFTVDYSFGSGSACITDNSLITLADGSQVAVKDLIGDEELLVWNMYTGTFDTAPILFIDKEEPRAYEVINLYFSDGTLVKVIDEHGFWDFNLNRYVYLRNDANKYIGHWFNKQTTDENGNLAYAKVQLTDVRIQSEITSAWSPVTFGHICYFVNGMLSIPGGIIGLINIFDVAPQTMKIDEESYLADIENYGLFTYEEFAEICYVPETIFKAFNGQYLKIAIGKGIVTIEELQNLILRYSKFWE